MAIELNAVVFSWDRPIVGREGIAAELFQTTTAYFEKLIKANKLASYEPVFLTSHSSNLNGFFLLKGTGQNIQTLLSDEEFMDINIRAGLCLNNVGIVTAATGNMVKELMARWTKMIPR